MISFLNLPQNEPCVMTVFLERENSVLSCKVRRGTQAALKWIVTVILLNILVSETCS